MTVDDDVLRELGEALDVAPSAGFAAGVRARVAESRGRRHGVWWALAAAAGITLAAVLLWRQPAEVPVTIASSQPAGVPQEAADPNLRTSEPPNLRTSEPRDRTPEPREVPALRTSAPPNLRTSEPPLVVITNQAAVLRALWAEAGVLPVEEAPAEPATPAELTPMAPPAPIAVDLIVVPPIVVSELGSTGERGSANPVIRRRDAAKETR